MKVLNIRYTFGSIIGLLSILLSIAFPQYLNWYYVERILWSSNDSCGIYLTGIGVLLATENAPSIFVISLLELFGGILVLHGSMAYIISSFKELKRTGMIGGILILLGPFLFLIDLLMGRDILLHSLAL